MLADIKGPNVAAFMKFSETTIRLYGSVAVAKGIVDFRNGPPGALLDNHLNILWVLVRRAPGPHGWQIVARQTTRIGPSTGTPAMKLTFGPAGSLDSRNYAHHEGVICQPG